ncbi:MAG: hypothetical protein K2U26_04115, partial [Cyclobacteriaceae bacterium]|nr:hypothetical protein [Chitinophagaceae bacterium]MBY0433277.1 hypothetical protein [Cyclobacteriaceae bacterium]
MIGSERIKFEKPKIEMKSFFVCWCQDKAWVTYTFKSVLLFILALFSCKETDKPEVKPIEMAAWSKFSGKILSASSEYVFSINSNTKKIDTILKKPSYITYQIYGAFGMMPSYDKRRVLYSVYGGGLSPKWGSIFSMNTDGSDNKPLLSNSAIMLSAAKENPTGSIAFFSGDLAQAASKLWIDDKSIIDFTSFPLGSPNRHTLDWHPQENSLLMSLASYQGGWFTSSLYKIQLPGIEVNPVLIAPSGSHFLYASYSADGKKIVFLSMPKSYSYEDISICTINADGTGLLKIA